MTQFLLGHGYFSEIPLRYGRDDKVIFFLIMEKILVGTGVVKMAISETVAPDNIVSHMLPSGAVWHPVRILFATMLQKKEKY